MTSRTNKRQHLLALFFFALCLGFFAAHAQAEKIEAIIIDPYVDLHIGPGRGYPIVYVIEKGQPVIMLKKRNDWIKVRTLKDVEGWAHRDNLALTLGTDGTLIEFDRMASEDYAKRNWNFGVAAGDFGGADLGSAYVGYRFTNNFTLEAKVNHAVGAVSDSFSGGFSLLHETWPHWRASPFFALGVGAITINPHSTIVDPQDRTDMMMMVGAGAHVYITRRFLLRAEYTNNLILTTREENEEVKEWKIGLNIFF